MRIPSSTFLRFAALIALAGPISVRLAAQQGTTPPAQRPDGAKPKPEETEVWEPIPKVVTPGATVAAPPSDAIILFDGKNLDEWLSARDKSPC